MPGRIVEVLRKAGDSVASGDPIVVVEAMKSRNSIIAHVPGKVGDVRVAIGDAVSEGDVLFTIEV